MFGIRSFRHRIFLAIVVVALVPTAATVALGVAGLRQVGLTAGTLGPWDAVAASGRDLIESARDAAPDDPAVARAAEEHGEALSRSLQRSRLGSLLVERSVELLPWAALSTVLLVGALAFLAAGALARGFGGPIQELVEWTRRIGRGEELPERGQGAAGAVPEFRELRAALREMSVELETARSREVEAARLRAWTEMARRVAHELKNPLTPMRMAAAGLERDPDPARAERGRILLEEIGRLDEMARTFSQFGRLPEGPASEIDVEELITGLARRHGDGGEGVAVAVAPDTPRIHGHLELLERALRNLLTNALEATAESPGAGDNEDGPAVRMEAEPLEGGGVRLRVVDRGPGLDPALADRIWEPDVTTRTRGTGLGLPMVRQAAAAHGGTAVGRNRADGVRGAEFLLELPLRPRSRPTAAGQASPSGGTAPPVSGSPTTPTERAGGGSARRTREGPWRS